MSSSKGHGSRFRNSIRKLLAPKGKSTSASKTNHVPNPIAVAAIQQNSSLPALTQSASPACKPADLDSSSEILLVTDVHKRQELYWERAYKILPEKHKAVLKDYKIDRENLEKLFEKLKRRTAMEPDFKADGDKPKQIMTRARLYSFLNGVQRLAGSQIPQSQDVAALFLGSIGSILDIALSDRDAFDVISTAANDIPIILRACERYDDIFFRVRAANVLESIPPIYAACLKFSAQSLLYASRNKSERIFRNAITSLKDELQPCIDEIHKQKRHIEDLTMESHYSITVALLESDERQNRQRILNSLSEVMPEDHHYHFQHGRIAGSGKWLFLKCEFEDWIKNDRSSIFWLYGQAGAGKTVLWYAVDHSTRGDSSAFSWPALVLLLTGFSSAVIDSLQDTYRQYPILYFYCNYKEDLRKRHDSVIRTLYRDLVMYASKDQLDKKLVNEYNSWSNQQRSSYLPLDKVKELFQYEASKYEIVFLIIDALDECDVDDRSKLVKYLVGPFLESSKSPQDPNIKIFLTSRHDKDIRNILEKKLKYEIHADDTLKDIRPFVEERFAELESTELFSSGNSDVKQEIIEALCGKAGGMFLWVDFQLKTFRELPTITEVRKQLQELPHTIDETYKRMLDQINVKPLRARQWAYKTLMWVFGAKELLSPEEIVGAVAIQIGSEKFNEDDFAKPVRLIDLCCNMVVIDSSYDGARKDVLRFAHFSVHEFLKPYFMDEAFVNRYSGFTSVPQLLGYSCLAALALYSPSELKRLALPSFTASSFYQYALNNIEYYSDDIDQISYNIINSYIKQLNFLELTRNRRKSSYSWYSEFSDKDIFMSDDEIFKHGDESEIFKNFQRPDCPQPVIHAYPLAYFNLSIILKYHLELHSDTVPTDALGELLFIATSKRHIKSMEMLITMGCNLNFLVTSPLANSLQVAAYNGFEDAVQILLDSGADVNIQGGQYGTALQAVTYKRIEKIVQMLLDADADVNIQGGLFGTALQAAAYQGAEKIVQVLLDAGADVDIQNGQFGTALQAAAYRGKEKIVQVLLNAGADVSIRGGDYGTALHAAVCKGTEKIVQMLLDAGADINLQTWQFGTALHAAAYKGMEKRVQMLLNAGAGVNIQGGQRGTPLQIAACRGTKEMIQMLLDAGADVDIEGGEYGTALQAAAYGGTEEIVQLLLDAGADVNIEGGEYGTALQAAAYRGTEEMIQMLLDAGADVNIEGGEYETALQAAAYRGKYEIVLMLLHADADVNIYGGKYGTALQAAASRGTEEVVQLLLDIGADVNIEGGEYGTALQAAAYQGAEKIVQVLLGAGADANIEGGRYGTALQIAASRGIEEVVQLLLDIGADVNIEGGEYGTALQAAAYQGAEKIVQVLLDAGADVNIEGGRYGTALQIAAYKGKEKIVQMLLDAGTDVNIQGGEYGTALQAAASSYDDAEGIVQILLDAGADVNIQGGEYGTALHAAAYMGHSNAISVLLRAGADVNAKEGEYGTVLEAARASLTYKDPKNVEPIVEMLIDAGAKE